MQYYTFKEACATKETGPVYPQIQKWKLGYDDDKPDSYYSYYTVAKSGYFPDFGPDLDSLVMHGNAKPTDLVSSIISTGFIITGKLKSLFGQFSLPLHRFYPAKVLHKKVALDDYYFMHIISDYTDFVDYPKSSFTISGFSNADPLPIILSSKQDYIDKSKQLQDDFFIKKRTYRSIGANEIYLNAEFEESLDIFRIGPFDINFYISKRLRNALVENKITGCDIELTSKIFI